MQGSVHPRYFPFRARLAAFSWLPPIIAPFLRARASPIDKTMLNRTLRRIAAVLILAAAPLLLAASGPAKVGELAPGFSFTTLAKRQVRLEDLKGQVVVINLWATWLGPRQAEMGSDASRVGKEWIPTWKF